ncbi:hypothetical protein PQX77_018953 [Marasmius sp. AFHP31]|nr:hypothetical protein PQX77_018953 [Marasmius sp. AFHP31]
MTTKSNSSDGSEVPGLHGGPYTSFEVYSPELVNPEARGLHDDLMGPAGNGTQRDQATGKFKSKLVKRCRIRTDQFPAESDEPMKSAESVEAADWPYDQLLNPPPDPQRPGPYDNLPGPTGDEQEYQAGELELEFARSRDRTNRFSLTGASGASWESRGSIHSLTPLEVFATALKNTKEEVEADRDEQRKWMATMQTIWETNFRDIKVAIREINDRFKEQDKATGELGAALVQISATLKTMNALYLDTTLTLRSISTNVPLAMPATSSQQQS